VGDICGVEAAVAVADEYVNGSIGMHIYCNINNNFNFILPTSLSSSLPLIAA
jgi:hypothetical protein